MKHRHIYAWISVLYCLYTGESARAAQTSSLSDVFLHGTPSVDLRYRYEHVEQDGAAKNAEASTLRARLGYSTGVYEGLKFAVTAETLINLGEENYNNSHNGQTDRPAVTDSEGSRLDTLALSYTGLDKTTVTLGRQLINLDNQRFVGAADWRQHRQTYDAVSIDSQTLDRIRLYYAFVHKVNRVTDPHSSVGAYESGSHILNASYEPIPDIKLSAYGYLLDFKDSPAAASQTYGARVSGKYPLSGGVNLLYTAEAATQSDYGSNPARYHEQYYFAEPGVAWEGWTAKFGYEALEGDGISAFQTPLATLHAFNGWADKFTVTPPAGLEDIYASLTYKLKLDDSYYGDPEFTVAYHDFNSSESDTDYGSEINFSVCQTIDKKYTLGFKLADYNAQSFAVDTLKAWVWFGFKR